MPPRGPAPKPQRLFREEALRHRQAWHQEGDVLRLQPAWADRTYKVLIFLAAAALVFALVFDLHEYASGPAVVRVNGRTDVTATASGTVQSVMVQPGERVKAGQVLVKFYVAAELSELDRVTHEFELQLVKILRDPGDSGARAALTSLRAQKDLAQAHVEERSTKAPHDGMVSDLRIRAGQLIGPGELILSLVNESSTYALTALLPGQYRPMLKPGGPMRLEMAGFEYCYQDLEIESVGDAVVGPTEVKRYLGQELADAVQLNGPVVLVQARMPTRTITCNNRTFTYFNGMNGTAQARVRAASILVTYVPALRYLFGQGDDS
jgi:membrane fusion protein (multidrug efflux system)